MTEKTIIIAGQSGGASTFLGGLYHHIEKQDGLKSISSIAGDREGYERCLDRLFTGHEYPKDMRGGYVVSFELAGGSFARPEAKVSTVRPPRGLDVCRSLLPSIRSGTAPEPERVREQYESDIKPELKRGANSITPDDWDTIMCHHYYTADKALILLNIHKVLNQNPPELAYDVEDIVHAVNRFESVAVVPTAVDLLDYDHDTSDRGIFSAAIDVVFSNRFRDEQLLEHLDEFLTDGEALTTKRILSHIVTNDAVDCFGVAVPDYGSPGESTGNLTPDGEGGFKTNGFEQVVRWLER
jgi:hypothetical protein